jgi:hypothetical protein
MADTRMWPPFLNMAPRSAPVSRRLAGAVDDSIALGSVDADGLDPCDRLDWIRRAQTNTMSSRGPLPPLGEPPFPPFHCCSITR